MCTVLGMVVVQENSENFDDKCKVIVANYTTKFDYVPIQLVVPHHVVNTAHYHLHWSPLNFEMYVDFHMELF